MALNLGSVIVRVGAEIGDLRSKMSEAERAVNNLGEKATALGRSLTIGVTAPLAALGGLSVSAAADLERLTLGLTSVTGSAEETQRQLKRLEGVARLPGLGFREAIQGSIRLQSVRIDAGLAERALIAFGNAVAVAGGGKAELDGITLALSQIAGKGKVAAEEINQIAERAPQVRAALIDAFGTADTEVIQKAGLSTTEFITRLVTELEKLPRAGNGAANSFENLSDSLFRARAAIGNQILPVIVPLVDGLARALESVRSLNPEVVRWGIAIAAVAAAAGPLLITLGSLTTAVTLLASALKVGLLGVVAAGGPLIIGLTALSALLLKNKLDSLAAAGAMDQYTASLSTLSQSSAEFKLRDLSRQAEELRARLAATPKEIQKVVQLGAAGGFGSTGFAAENPEYARLAEDLREVNQQFGVVARRLTDLRTAGAAGARGIEPFTVKVAAASTAAGEMQRAIQALDATLRSSTIVGLSDFSLRVGGLEIDPEALERFKEDMRRRLELTAALDLELKKVTVPDAPSAGGNAGAFAGITGALSGFVGSLKAQLVALASSFGPLAIAAAILAPVFQGLKDAVGPALTALAVPLRVVGQVLGAILVPTLRLLFPPLKFFGILVAMVGEGLSRLLGWILDAVAAIVQGIGAFIAKLGELLPSWLGGNKIEKFGKGIIEAGDYIAESAAGARATARELEKTQKELKDLSFEEAMKGAADATRAFTETLSNVPAIFDLAARKRQAVLGGAPAPAVGGGLTPGGTQPTDRGGNLPPDRGGLTVNIINPPAGMNPDATAEQLVRAIQKPKVRYELRRAVGVAI